MVNLLCRATCICTILIFVPPSGVRVYRREKCLLELGVYWSGVGPIHFGRSLIAHLGHTRLLEASLRSEDGRCILVRCSVFVTCP